MHAHAREREEEGGEGDDGGRGGVRREGGEVMTEGAATLTCLPPPHTIDYVAESWRRRRVARTLNGPRVAGFVTTSAWLWLKSRSVFTHDRIDGGEGQQHGRGRPCYEASRRRRRTAGPTLAHPGPPWPRNTNSFRPTRASH